MPPVTLCEVRSHLRNLAPKALPGLTSPSRGVWPCCRAQHPALCPQKVSFPACSPGGNPPVLGLPPKPQTEFLELQEQQLVWVVVLGCSCSPLSVHAPVPQEPGMLLEAAGLGSTLTQDGRRRNPSSAAPISPWERCILSPPKSSGEGHVAGWHLLVPQTSHGMGLE